VGAVGERAAVVQDAAGGGRGPGRFRYAREGAWRDAEFESVPVLPPRPGPTALPLGEPGEEAARLLERFRETAAAESMDVGSLDAFRAWMAAGRELIAWGGAAGFAEVLCSERRLWPWSGPKDPLQSVLVGLAARDTEGNSGGSFPEGNVWGIPTGATVEQVVRHVWAPLADRVPAIVDKLAERVFAVALVSHPVEGDFLAYLYVETVPDAATDWTAPLSRLPGDGIALEVCWGGMPRALSGRDTVPLLGGPVPTSLRELALVHGSLHTTYRNGSCDPTGLEPYTWGYDSDEIDEDYTLEDYLGFPPERFVFFGGHQDGGAAFDLDRLDPQGDPMVALHDCNDGLDTENEMEFWAWFNQYFPFFLVRD
jgi:hypothetical protein